MSERAAFLLSTSSAASRILEIGPAHAPIAAKRDGWNSRSIDTTDAEGLRRKFAGTGSDIEAIEAVDFIWTDGGLDQAVPNELHGGFDTLIASHVIEHMPDMVGFFQAATKLLDLAGHICLAVPDYRYCFDCFKPPSTTGAVVAAHLARASRHRRATVFDHMAYSVSQNGVGAWGQHEVGAFALMDRLERAFETAAAIESETGGPYIDSHAWQLTPARFALILLELRQLGLIDWQIAQQQETRGCEFLVILERGNGAKLDTQTLNSLRLALLRQSLAEAREQADFVLGVPMSPIAAQLRSLQESTQQSLQPLAQALAEQRNLLDGQTRRLRDIDEVTQWQRQLLSPLRALWRRLRPPMRR